ncbi:MAG: hypothetical protein MPK62_01100 [Alphaproteobacteria bacterium]|nr:hypothetical protein [Nitrosopumilus sp.]MDA8008211.1 hypothetical protein [Alphaproteobacteria bacterium]MDA8029732.1 hypothetical protein [Alphaproteobacteria bacterium]
MTLPRPVHVTIRHPVQSLMDLIHECNMTDHHIHGMGLPPATLASYSGRIKSVHAGAIKAMSDIAMDRWGTMYRTYMGMGNTAMARICTSMLRWYASYIDEADRMRRDTLARKVIAA